ncbi:uncharacterized protein HGUI_03402 [Hanseniaspora guilliermondii]|uniref:CAP-Gly domain-containing protein n=1 Tax=Hanseniaspora guilliermondii TaxID=56406 RepID=A0A1L0B4A4_9ASCO|nr:uncharacterized protein HGUI_03402 [Hanseniaspora guilliermondii]
MKPISTYYKLLETEIHLPIEGISHPVLLKYIGYLQSQPTLYCGFDILEVNLGKNNGSYNGVQYFETKFTNSGLFIPLYKISQELELALMNRPNTKTEESENTELNKQIEMLTTEKQHLLEVIEKNQVLIDDFEHMMNLVETKVSDCLARIKVLETKNEELTEENQDLKAQIRRNVDNEFNKGENDYDMDYKENLTPIKMK